MTTLVSDETLGKVVRLVWERPILLADRTAIMTHVLEDQWAAALDVARELLSPEDDAIAALDRANEEAADTYDRENANDERDFISRAADALNADFDRGVAAGLDGRAAAMGAISIARSKVEAIVPPPFKGFV